MSKSPCFSKKENIFHLQILSCLLAFITSQPLIALTTPRSLTHEVGHYLAHGSSKDEVLEDAGDEGKGHAEDSHHQVTDSER